MTTQRSSRSAGVGFESFSTHQSCIFQTPHRLIGVGFGVCGSCSERVGLMSLLVGPLLTEVSPAAVDLVFVESGLFGSSDFGGDGLACE